MLEHATGVGNKTNCLPVKGRHTHWSTWHVHAVARHWKLCTKCRRQRPDPFTQFQAKITSNGKHRKMMPGICYVCCLDEGQSQPDALNSLLQTNGKIHFCTQGKPTLLCGSEQSVWEFKNHQVFFQTQGKNLYSKIKNCGVLIKRHTLGLQSLSAVEQLSSKLTDVSSSPSIKEGKKPSVWVTGDAEVLILVVPRASHETWEGKMNANWAVSTQQQPLAMHQTKICTGLGPRPADFAISLFEQRKKDL